MAPSQSMSCDSCAACSATADCARCPFTRARLCSFSRCPRVYVGQTGRTLAQRLKEHKRALVNGHLAQSAVAEHAAQESHDIDWEGATVMDVQQQYHRRCLLESWHIRSALKTMNREEGNLPPVYDLLIRQSHSPD